MLSTPQQQLQSQLESAYQIAKLQAATDGAFDEALMQHWFMAAWDLCAEMIGFTYPPREVRESVCCSQYDGTVRLSQEPSSDVRFYSNGTHVATVPPNSVALGGSVGCPVDLCCYCNLVAYYTVGTATCYLPPRFVQAVARVFAYICENRGDVEMDADVIAKCGATAFLGPDLRYVA